MSGTFDPFAYVDGRAFPEETVEIYVDEKSMRDYARNDGIIKSLKADLKNVLGTSTEGKALKARIKEVEKENSALAEKVRSTALHITLRGLPPRDAAEIYNGYAEKAKEDGLAQMKALIAAQIVTVVNADGETADTIWTYDTVDRLAGSLPTASWMALVRTSNKITVASTEFENSADPGFFPKF